MNGNGRNFVDRALDALSLCRLLDLTQIVSGHRCFVLVYHSVASGEYNPYMEPEPFTSHVDMLLSEFHILSADEYLWHFKKIARFPRRSVLITFDDGFENNYTVVRPIMERRRTPWVLFTTTQSFDDPDAMLWFAVLRGICMFSRIPHISLLGRSWSLEGREQRATAYKEINRWVSEFSTEESQQAVREFIRTRQADIPAGYLKSFCSMMTAEQLRDLSTSGLVEIGCHTRSHPFLPRVSSEELNAEIDLPTKQLSELLNRKIRMFAYPSGCYGQRELKLVAELGFECAFAVLPVFGKVRRYEIPRVGIYNASVTVARAKSLGLSSLLRLVGIKTG